MKGPTPRLREGCLGALLVTSVFAPLAVGAALADDATTDAKMCDPDGGKGKGGGNDCPPPPPPAPCDADSYDCCVVPPADSGNPSDIVYDPCDPCTYDPYACCTYTVDSTNGSADVVYYPCDPCSCYGDMPCIMRGAEGSTEGSQDGSTAEPLLVCYPCPVETMATDGTTTEGTGESDTVCPM